MTKIIMLGCNGRMGQMITDMVKQDDECTIVAGIDIVDNRDNGLYTDNILFVFLRNNRDPACSCSDPST